MFRRRPLCFIYHLPSTILPCIRPIDERCCLLEGTRQKPMTVLRRLTNLASLERARHFNKYRQELPSYATASDGQLLPDELLVRCRARRTIASPPYVDAFMEISHDIAVHARCASEHQHRTTCTRCENSHPRTPCVRALRAWRNKIHRKTSRVV